MVPHPPSNSAPTPPNSVRHQHHCKGIGKADENAHMDEQHRYSLDLQILRYGTAPLEGGSSEVSAEERAGVIGFADVLDPGTSRQLVEYQDNGKEVYLEAEGLQMREEGCGVEFG